MNYKSILFIVALFLFSCKQEQNCDLAYYPQPPYSFPDDTYYSDTMVRYLYVCWNDSGYNKIYSYVMTDDCWELIVDEEPNLKYYKQYHHH